MGDLPEISRSEFWNTFIHTCPDYLGVREDPDDIQCENLDNIVNWCCDSTCPRVKVKAHG